MKTYSPYNKMATLTDPYFDIFGQVQREDSTTEFEYIEYLPRDSNNVNKNGQHVIETKD